MHQKVKNEDCGSLFQLNTPYNNHIYTANDKWRVGAEKKDNKTRKNEKMAECLHILGHFIVVYDQICCLNVVKCQKQQLNLIPQVDIVWENVFICLCMLFTSKVMTHSVTLLQTVMFRSGTLNGWKWRPWDIISAWYLSDSESRHSKDTKKSGAVKKAGGCAWTPPSSPTTTVSATVGPQDHFCFAILRLWTCLL